MKSVILGAVLVALATPTLSESYVMHLRNKSDQPITANGVAVMPGEADSTFCFKFPLEVKYDDGKVSKSFIVKDTGQKCTAEDGSGDGWKFTASQTRKQEEGIDGAGSFFAWS